MVRLHGQRFLFNQDGEMNKFGFHATKYVQADTPEAPVKRLLSESIKVLNSEQTLQMKEQYTPR